MTRFRRERVTWVQMPTPDPSGERQRRESRRLRTPKESAQMEKKRANG